MPAEHASHEGNAENAGLVVKVGVVVNEGAVENEGVVVNDGVVVMIAEPSGAADAAETCCTPMPDAVEPTGTFIFIPDSATGNDEAGVPDVFGAEMPL